jgi:uncharacterized membrane protein
MNGVVSLVLALHALAGAVWVGGMFFAYVVLRPAAGALDPPVRLALWSAVLGRFFAWVWGIVVVLPVTGLLLIHLHYGGSWSGLWHVHTMTALGIVMIGLFVFLALRPFRSLRQSLARGDLSGAGAALAGVRRIVALNLTLGLVILAVAAGGRLAG